MHTGLEQHFLFPLTAVVVLSGAALCQAVKDLSNIPSLAMVKILIFIANVYQFQILLSSLLDN